MSASASTIEASVVRSAARGNWLGVLDRLAPELGKAIEKLGRHTPCPVHQGQDGFRLFKDANRSGGGVCNTCGTYPDGFALLQWLKDWDFPRVLEAVAGTLGLSRSPVPPATRVVTVSGPAVSPMEIRRRRLVLRKIWSDAKPADHRDAEPMRRYLENRGLEVWEPDMKVLRFHPGLQYRDDDNKIVGVFPAMVGLVSAADGEPLTIHRTFLTCDGRKAPVESPKKLMPAPTEKSWRGAAIRLGAPGRVLSIAEGIETALAVFEATGMVTWATVNASLLERFVPPPSVENLFVWADNDPVKKGKRAGQDAAKGLQDRMSEQGIEVVTLVPVLPGAEDDQAIDWLDVLNKTGLQCFPSIQPFAGGDRSGAV